MVMVMVSRDTMDERSLNECIGRFLMCVTVCLAFRLIIDVCMGVNVLGGC